MSNGSEKKGCLGMFFVRKVSPPPESVEAGLTFPYGIREEFLSSAELSFFHVLKSVLPEDWTLLAKVNLADVFFVHQPHRNQAARNRIDRKHVDFLLCESSTMRPLLGIELDDASHERIDRKERDGFVNQVFEAAGLPILHVKAARGYQPAALLTEIRSKLGLGPPPMPEPEV